MPRVKLRKAKCKDMIIFKFGHRHKSWSMAAKTELAQKCIDFRNALFETVTGNKYKDFWYQYPFMTHKCQQEEIEYDHAVVLLDEERCYTFIVLKENLELANWVEKYFNMNDIKYKRVMRTRLTHFEYNDKPFYREEAKKFKAEHSHLFNHL